MKTSLFNMETTSIFQKYLLSSVLFSIVLSSIAYASFLQIFNFVGIAPSDGYPLEFHIFVFVLSLFSYLFNYLVYDYIKCIRMAKISIVVKVGANLIFFCAMTVLIMISKGEISEKFVIMQLASQMLWLIFGIWGFRSLSKNIQENMHLAALTFLVAGIVLSLYNISISFKF